MDFENINVLHQLRCGGVLEAVRISCAGYPTKTPYEDFVDHFWNLVPELLSNQELDDVALSKAVLKKANLVGYQCGQTKVRGCPVWSPVLHQGLSKRACHCQSGLSSRRLTVVRKCRDSPGCSCAAMSHTHPCGSNLSKEGHRREACPHYTCCTQCRLTEIDPGCLLSHCVDAAQSLARSLPLQVSNRLVGWLALPAMPPKPYSLTPPRRRRAWRRFQL